MILSSSTRRIDLNFLLAFQLLMTSPMICNILINPDSEHRVVFISYFQFNSLMKHRV